MTQRADLLCRSTTDRYDRDVFDPIFVKRAARCHAIHDDCICIDQHWPRFAGRDRVGLLGTFLVCFCVKGVQRNSQRREGQNRNLKFFDIRIPFLSRVIPASTDIN